MRLLHDRTAALRLGFVCAALLAVVAMAPAASATDWSKNYTVTGRANVRVDTNDGSVRVTTGDSKTVQFHIEYEGYELNSNLHIESKQTGDTVELIARTTGHWGWSWGAHCRRLHIDILMPQEADLDAHTGDGSVEANSIHGKVSVYTGDGSVRANSLTGTIELHTNDGSINVDTLKGDIRLHTGDGSIEARELDGKLDADSGDGHVRIAGRFDGLNIKTGDGSVDTRVLPGSKMATSWIRQDWGWQRGLSAAGRLSSEYRCQHRRRAHQRGFAGHRRGDVQQLAAPWKDEWRRAAIDDSHRGWIDPAEQGIG